MTEPHETGLKPPAAPYLVSPQEEAVLDGTAVAFRWEPVEGAAFYRLEVAADPAFATVVHHQSTEAVSVTVSGVFATEGATYYWRVFAGNEAGESHGENVESFISATADVAAQHVARPDHEERLGPLTELMTGGSEDVLYLRTGEGQPAPTPIEVEEGVEAYYAAEDEIGVQHEGVEARQILGFIFVLLAVIAAVVLIVLPIIRNYTQGLRDDVAAQLDYPDLRETELKAAAQLTQYGVIDAQRGVYRIPIDRAIDLMLDEAYRASAGNVSP